MEVWPLRVALTKEDLEGINMGQPVADGALLGWLKGAAKREGRANDWLDGATDTLGCALGVKFGAPVNVGLVLGLLKGALKVEGLSECMDVGISVLMGDLLGWLLGYKDS